MAVKTDAELLAAATIIKNNTADDSNSADVIGQFLFDVIDSKANAADIVGIQQIKVSISSAEILALNGTPKILVAAPGAGKLVLPLSLIVRYNFVTTAYSGSTTLTFFPNTIFSQNFSILSALSSRYDNVGISDGGGAVLGSAGVNTNFNVYVAGSNPAAGDGTLDIYLSYAIITL